MKYFEKIRNIPYSDKNGILESVQVLEKCSIPTSIGQLVPIYEVDDHGRKKLTPVKFRSDGSIKSIALQEPKEIQTSIGFISAELVTFYPNGALCRAFPLNGKLSGYWSEANEYKLAQAIKIKSSVGELSVKPINLHFYETGELCSLTLWPQERAKIKTAYGNWTIKNGISFHKNGELASCEPEFSVDIDTPLGRIGAYDPDPNGICGHKNSLNFTESGRVAGLSSISSTIRVENKEGDRFNFEPKVMRSYCNDDEFIVQPLKIEFHNERVIFKNGFKTAGMMDINSSFNIEAFKPEFSLTMPMSCLQ
jgi:hypothetical protein